MLATASSVTKAAKLETGLVVQVPAFINEGEKICVDTSEGAYLAARKRSNLSICESGCALWVDKPFSARNEARRGNCH